MREILFRAKQKDNKQWVQGSLLFYPGVNRTFVSLGEFRGSEFIEVLKDTVGQYTGLTDKNGTKIFEGDIVQDVIEPKAKGIVRFGDYETSYRDWTPVADPYSKHTGFFIEWNNMNFCKDVRFWNEKVKVIGDIHDNPELLKEGAPDE